MKLGGDYKETCSLCYLQRAIRDQILNPHQLYDFAKGEIPGITCFLLIISKLMMFQNLWLPDMKMSDNLEEAEKTISLFPVVTTIF